MDKCAHDGRLSNYLGKAQAAKIKQIAEKCEHFAATAAGGMQSSAGGKAGDGKCNLLAIARYAQQEQQKAGAHHGKKKGDIDCNSDSMKETMDCANNPALKAQQKTILMLKHMCEGAVNNK